MFKNLKKYSVIQSFLLSLVFFYSGTLVAQKDSSFLLNGKVEDPKVSKVFIFYYSDLVGKGIRDSSPVKKGMFSIKGRIGTPAFAYLSLTNSRVLSDSMWGIFIEPRNMNITLRTRPYKVRKMTGSPSFTSYDSLEKQKEILLRKYDAVFKLYTSSTQSVKDSLAADINKYEEEKKNVYFPFFFANPNSIVTSYLLQSYHRKVSIDTLESLFDAMNDDTRRSVYGENLRGFIEKENNLLVGKPAPLFSSITIDSSTISLSDFKGRYVILDFWAHWCIPCRRSFPEMIRLHEKFKGKGLEIIGIASDDFEVTKWKEAIKKDKISIWHNILDGKKKAPTGEIDLSQAITRKYNVGYLPTKIVIDKDGKIIGRFVGDKDEKLIELLEQKFSENSSH